MTNEQIFEKYKAFKLKEKIIQRLHHCAFRSSNSELILPLFETESNHKTVSKALAYYLWSSWSLSELEFKFKSAINLLILYISYLKKLRRYRLSILLRTNGRILKKRNVLVIESIKEILYLGRHVPFIINFLWSEYNSG